MKKSFKPAHLASLPASYRDLREQRPDGWWLAHNHIRHIRRTQHGTRGFRAFWLDPASHPEWVVCECGWRPELGVHYRRPWPERAFHLSLDCL